MNKVTQATENKINKMVKANCAHSTELQSLLRTMKCRIGWDGATITEINKYESEGLNNSNQFDVTDANYYLGMNILFSDFISVVNTLDLHYVTIKDFNKLVSACYKKYMN